MRKLLLLALLLSYFTFTGQAQTVPSLGKAFPFTTLAKTGVNSSGETKIYGNAGVAPGTTFIGFPPGQVYGSQEVNTQAAIDAQADLLVAYNQAAAFVPTQNLSGQNLGGLTLKPGVYRFDNDANLDGNLILDNNGDVNAVFIFQVRGKLNVSTGGRINYKDGAAPRIKNIFWQVAGTTTLGSNSLFRGTILAQDIIYAALDATVYGRLLTYNGSITLNKNTITIPTDLEVTITKSPGDAKGNYYVGNTVTYTVVAKNNGPIDETGVRVTLLNAGLTYVGHNAPPGTTYISGMSQWTIPALASGASTTLTVTTTINNNAEANLANTATILGDGLDEVRENNDNTVTICVSPANPSDISGLAAVCVGSEQTYSVTDIKVATQYNWTVPTGWTILGNTTGSSIKVIVGPAGGDITVTASNTCSISEVKRKSIIVATAPSPAPGAITASNGTNNPCSGTQNVTYSVAAIPNAQSYIWVVPTGWTITAGATTNSITVTVGTGAGEISVRAVNPCGPSEKSVLNVLPSSAAPTAATSIAGSAAPCTGETADYSVSGETGATYFNWALPTGWRIISGAGTNSITVEVGPTGGSITVSGINGCGTSSTTSLAVSPTVKTAPSIIDGPLTPCASPEGLVYTYTVGAVQGATSYFWRVTGGLTISEGQGSASIKIKVTSAVTTGTIYVSALNTCGQSTEKSITITPLNKPARPGSITAASTMPCAGDQNLRFSITPVAGATSYAWTFPTGWVISGASDGTFVTVRAGTTAGNVSVVAINSCGAGTERTLALNPTLNSPEKPLSLTGSTSLCSTDREVVYSVAAGADATGYRWEVPANWTIVSGHGTTSIKVNPGNTGGIVRVVALNNCGESVAATVSVIVSTTPTPAPGFITTSPIAPCVNQQNVSFSVDEIFGATAYEWTVSGDWAITSGQGTSTIKVTIGSGSGTVSVKARNGCGLSAASSTTVQPATVAPVTPVTVVGRTAVCELESNVTYTVTGMTNVTGYNWTITGGSDWSITSGQGTASIKVKAGVAPAEISVVAINNCGQSSAKVIQVVTSKVAPGAPSSIIGRVNICAGNTNIEYSVAPVTGATSYIWTLPTGWTYTQNAAGNTILATIGTTSGKIKVRAVNGCGESTESELSVAPTSNTPPKPGNILAATTTVCEGEQGISYIVPPVNGATSYAWTVPADWTITSGQGSTTISVTVGKTAGKITVAAVNNCGASIVSEYTVTPRMVPPKPEFIASQTIPCANSTGNTYSVKVIPGVDTYTWSVPAGWDITAGAGTSSITVEAGINAGEITVKASNDCGVSETATLQVTTTTTAPTTPLAITGNQKVCAGETEVEYKVEAIANTSTYTWTVPTGWNITSGQGTTRIMVQPSTTPGNISVVAGNGCGVSSASRLSVEIIGTLPATPALITGTVDPCSNATGLVYSISAVSNATNYDWTVPVGWTITAGQGTTSITVTTNGANGEVGVSARNTCGSSPARKISVTSRTTPIQPTAIVGDNIVCSGNTVEYKIDPVDGATSYTWGVPSGWTITSGQGTTTLVATVGSGSGNVQVSAENACGRSTIAILPVATSASKLSAPGNISGIASFICSGQEKLTYTVTPVNDAASYLWSVPELDGWKIISGQGTNSIVVNAGTKSGNVTVRVLNGCGESSPSILPVSINEGNTLPIGAISGLTDICANQTDIRYSVDPVPNASTYNWIVPADWTIQSGQGTNSILVTLGNTKGDVTVEAYNACTIKSSQKLFVEPKFAPKTPVISVINSACTGLELEIEPIPGARNYTWTLPDGWVLESGQTSTRIRVSAPKGSEEGAITVVANGPLCNSAPASIELSPENVKGEIEIATALTPNGDNINDTWKIKNIENYQENELIIMNRWGSEVYRTKGYKNDWKGGELSEGTYFYLLNVVTCDGKRKSYDGFLMIIR
ncbi:ice-binding family protein [Rufibacter sp. DG15C]|uniref:ice-binding family protein n=1 Tax=Rufibacter sp. DG15C TaxID=1379909 RepID=UPI00082A6080|nr:ice-binding family protein [Rufibacter sp. DG15C]